MLKAGREWSAKAIRMHLANGWSESEFISYYSFSGLDELKKQLKLLYKYDKRTMNFILSDMKRNGKKKKRSANSENSTIMQVEVPDNMQLSVIQMVNTTDVATTEVNPETEIEAPITSLEKAGTAEAIEVQDGEEKSPTVIALSTSKKQKQIEETHAKIEQIRETLEKLQKAKRKIMSENLEATKRLKSIMNSLTQLQEKVRSLKAQAIAHTELILKTPIELAENEKLQISEQKKLKDLETQYNSLKLTSLYLDEADDSTARAAQCDCYLDDMEIANDEIMKKARKLMENDNIDVIEEFSIKELKKIAKIIIALEQIEKNASTVALKCKQKSNFVVAVELITNRIVTEI
ncbi:MAG: hypothetical protein IKD76_03730 [Clostridia bacterium]|nr:hypothetical protein [Clostridia bacterium]